MALAWPSSIEVSLHRTKIKIQSRRTSLDNHANSTAVGFAEGADPEEISEAAAHDRFSLVGAYVAAPSGVFNDEGMPCQSEATVRIKAKIRPQGLQILEGVAGP